MSKNTESYNAYLDMIEALYNMPSAQEQALRSAAQTGAQVLLDLESRKRSVNENWQKIDRLQRELDSKIHRISNELGVVTHNEPFPVSCGSSAELLRFLQQSAQELEGIESTWRHLTETSKTQDMGMRAAMPQAPPATSEPITQDQVSAEEKKIPGSILLGALGAVLLLVVVLLLYGLTQG